MIEIIGVATVLDFVMPCVDGKASSSRHGEVLPTRIMPGGVSRNLGGVPMLLSHDPHREVGEVVELWEAQRDGRTVLGVRARVWAPEGIRAAAAGSELSVGSSAAPAGRSVEIVDGVEVHTWTTTTIDEVSFVRAGACGHRARVLSWRPLVAGGRSR